MWLASVVLCSETGICGCLIWFITFVMCLQGIWEFLRVHFWPRLLLPWFRGINAANKPLVVSNRWPHLKRLLIAQMEELTLAPYLLSFQVHWNILPGRVLCCGFFGFVGVSLIRSWKCSWFFLLTLKAEQQRTVSVFLFSIIIIKIFLKTVISLYFKETNKTMADLIQK